jgi:hypothetical protein
VSKGREEIIGEVWLCLCEVLDAYRRGRELDYDHVRKILKVETPTHRLAIVRKKADAIEVAKKLGIEHDGRIGFSDLHGDDMLSAGFVQEEK